MPHERVNLLRQPSNLQLLCAKCNLAKGKKTGHYDESDVLGSAGDLAASDSGA
jgi:5-methylcytosine-specific restriction endonuclease McrA